MVFLLGRSGAPGERRGKVKLKIVKLPVPTPASGRAFTES